MSMCVDRVNHSRLTVHTNMSMCVDRVNHSRLTVHKNMSICVGRATTVGLLFIQICLYVLVVQPQ